MLFSMRPSIPLSQDASDRLKLLKQVHTMVRYVLLRKHEIHERSEPSTVAHFVRGDKVSVVTTNLFLREQPNKKLRDRQLGLFYSGRANWQTQLHIETSRNSTLTSCVSCEQPTTLLYPSTTTNCTGNC
jgi:hypothetical protein